MRILYPLSIIYAVLSRFNRAFTAQRKLSKPVISIGNITWGGTGKTPCVIKLASELVNHGFKPAVLSRGYFRKDKSKSFVAVSDGKNTLVPPEISGDEPCLIAESVPGAVVMAGKNRLGAAEYAAQRFSPDIFILDDGFQHWKIKRDLDIVCVSALNPFGNGLMIPAGILREPLKALKRADLVVITNSDMVSEKHLADTEAAISRHCPGKIINGKYSPLRLRRIIDGMAVEIKKLKDMQFMAISAIADNLGFKKMLEKSGINAKKHLDFRDHHWYNLDEIKHLNNAFNIVTTAKDAVRLKSLLKHLPLNEAERFYALEIELELVNGVGIWENKINSMPRFS